MWSVPAAAPLLGLAGIAGAYPAVAGPFRGAWTRAALGAIGLWWLLLAEPLLARDLALGTPPGDAADVLDTLASSGALLLAPLWAVAAVVLPWLVAGRARGASTSSARSSGPPGWRRRPPAWPIGPGSREPRGLAAGTAVAGAIARHRRTGAEYSERRE